MFSYKCIIVCGVADRAEVSLAMVASRASLREERWEECWEEYWEEECWEEEREDSWEEHKLVLQLLMKPEQRAE